MSILHSSFTTDNNTGNFTWDYGQQIKFNNWAPNEPTNTPGQDCVFINTGEYMY